MDWEKLIREAHAQFDAAVAKEVNPTWPADKRHLVRRRLQSQLDIRLAEIADARKAAQRQAEYEARQMEKV